MTMTDQEIYDAMDQLVREDDFELLFARINQNAMNLRATVRINYLRAKAVFWTPPAPECEYGNPLKPCTEVVRGWHGRHICGPCLGYHRDGVL